MIWFFIFTVEMVLMLFFYCLMVTGKRADEELHLLFEQKIQEEQKKEEEPDMESRREVLRMMEKEIKKGSAPVRFAGLRFTEDSYHLVESQAKMNQLLDYFFRNGEFAVMADKQIRSNVYMDGADKNPRFRPAKSDRDRRAMEESAKRWMRKKHPAFDGDVYVEEIRCLLEIPEEEKEIYKCRVNGEETTAFIFSRKHLTALYLQCLMMRKEVMQGNPELEELSEVCSRIYRLENVEVLFQCMLFDQMNWEDGKLYGQFCTVYRLKES